MTEVACTIPCQTFEWTVSSWSACNVTCGTGYASRSVHCNNGVKNVEATYCDGSAPVESLLCAGVSETCTGNNTWNWGEWTSCSASCGTGHETRDRWCVGVEGIIDDTNCDCDEIHTYRSCNLGPCDVLEWVVGSYGDCSVSCGKGYRERSVHCESKSRGVVANSECEASIGEKPAGTKLCTVAALPYCPEYEFFGEGFGDCSVTCGTGQSTQTVVCREIHTFEIVSEAYCIGSVPVTVQTCSSDACEVFSWESSSWEDCSTTCGNGQKSRSVRCVGSYGTVDTTYTLCSGEMPSLLASCLVGPCPVCAYVPGEFGDCSASCGGGLHTRTVGCYCDGSLSDDSECVAQGRTSDFPTSATCATTKCTTFSWQASGWGECSVTCGSGYKYQTVVCMSSLGEEVEATLCTETKPETQGVCAGSSPCPSAHPETGAWGDCSASCGAGTNTREVWCVLEGVVVDADQCDDMPATYKNCNDGACETFSWDHGAYGDCSLTCKGGVQVRDVWCVSDQRGTVHNAHCTGSKPVEVAQCNADVLCPTYEYSVSSFGECSASCGAGVATATLTCVESVGLTVVDDSYCSSLAAPATVEVCVGKPCEIWEWVPATWGDCSASCGQGISSRSVSCVGRFSSAVDLTLTFCNSTRPAIVMDCVEPACPEYVWFPGGWSICSATCGEGVITRSVVCTNKFSGETVADEFCADLTAISTTADCEMAACPTPSSVYTYHYHSGDWSSCSVSCGEGYQTRTVTCRETLTVTYMGETTITTIDTASEYCDAFALIAPDTQKSCSESACLLPSWTPAQWSDCSASCGDGTQTRTVVCALPTGTVVADYLCAATKPATVKGCKAKGPCETWCWNADDWSSCSVSCGPGGYQTRKVVCKSSFRGNVPFSECEKYASTTKPADTMSCSAALPCPVCSWSAGQWGSCSTDCGAGLQTRTLTCTCSDGTSGDALCSSKEHCSWPSQKTCVEAGGCEIYEWTEESWSSCSATCGSGVMTRAVVCKGIKTGDIDLTGARCSGVESPATSKQCTATIPICEVFEPEYSSFGECSASCGFGTQTRTYSCVGSYGTVDTTGVACAAFTIESLTQDCFETVCETCSWQVTTFSTCSVTCGGGVQTREVACIGTLGSICDASECAGTSAPELTEECELACCTKYSWFVGRFGDCSVSCGIGTKSRDVYCHDAEGLVVDASYCEGSAPSFDEACMAEATCDAPAWANGEWSDCSASCGAGTRTRDVWCRAVDNSHVDESLCSGTAPSAATECNLCACETIEWEVTSWSSCSASCGAGFESRGVECRSTLRGYVPFVECTESQPIDHQSCGNVCYSWVPGSWGTCSATDGTGTQSRNVYCVATDGTIDKTGALCTGSQPVDTLSCYGTA